MKITAVRSVKNSFVLISWNFNSLKSAEVTEAELQHETTSGYVVVLSVLYFLYSRVIIIIIIFCLLCAVVLCPVVFNQCRFVESKSAFSQDGVCCQTVNILPA